MFVIYPEGFLNSEFKIEIFWWKKLRSVTQ